MKILDAAQIREWDSFTIAHEPIASIGLMERAAAACLAWLEENDFLDQSFTLFCGKGNNGGDGLAIARMLSERHCKAAVHILEFGHLGTEDFQLNLERLHQCEGVEIKFIQSEEQFPNFKNEIIIDALFGSGLNRPLEGVTAKLVHHINNSNCKIISIDVPSGLPVDKSGANGTVIRSSHTLSFQTPKLAFMAQENARFIGKVHILNIGLADEYYNDVETAFELTDRNSIRSIYKVRDKFAHKGKFGHGLIVAGSYGKMGAAVLCARACLRSGAGLTSTHIPRCGYEIMQISVPEAMVMTDFNSSVVTNIEEDLTKFSTVGIGPGIGTATETKRMMHQVFEQFRKPMVIDADAINVMASDKELLKKLPSNSILTPHPKEFERLFGTSNNDFDRMDLAKRKAAELGAVIVLKGHHSLVSSPVQSQYFNNTGNAGMAKGGSGDVLTGIITALLCQQYNPLDAARFGVYLHGMAGDIAAEKYSKEAMTAGDIVENLGEAFVAIPAVGN